MTEEFLIRGPMGITFTATSTAGVTAGDLVYAAASDDAVSFTQQYPEWDDITVETATTSTLQNVVGIALTTAAASSPVTVVTEGIFLFQGESTTGVTAGYPVAHSSNTAQRLTDAASNHMEYCIGRALTGTSNAASKYGVFLLRV